MLSAPRRLTRRLGYAVDAEAVDTGHGGNRLAHVLAFPHEDGPDQIAHRKRMLGRQGMHRVSEFATLNANYLMKKLSEAGFELAYPGRRAGHGIPLRRRDASPTPSAPDPSRG